ncbi:pentatricopeptide repeat (PPR) superfamily protein [Actinidia rufa]|uniref:Pentatricopeptide repeat (PPR) superfamily protein n=1 Tax=Actinidia rufa TaxID=165716 RepID=A0A7J0DW93_9ERIC|nr:pentatricopeptide repeat (PPR) superfamily protein [Actinidia rufa]
MRVSHSHPLCRSGFTEIPRRLNSPDSNIFERNVKRKIGKNFDVLLGNGGIGKLSGKERLKSYSERLRNCALNLSLNEGKEIHGVVIKNGIDPDMHLWVSLINFYAKCGGLDFARRVLDEMPERDVVSWTALITGFVSAGRGSDGVYLFGEMRREGITPNEFTLATGLKAGSMSLDLAFGKQVHAEVIKLGIFSDIFVGSALVDLYAKCGEMKYADKVFFWMPEQNAVSWNALLNGYAQVGNGEEVLKLFCMMTKSKMEFSKFTLSTVLKGLANSGDLGAGRVVHSMAIKIGCDHDEFVSSTLLDMYSKCGLADDALKVFTRIKSPDVVAWTAMITCLDQQGQKQEAARLFLLMRDTSLRPNQFTLASLVSAAADLDPHYCESIHACVYKYGFESENVVNNALVAMYAKIGSVDNGYRVFAAMSARDVVSWNALLSGFHDSGTCDQGLKIFIQMLSEGFKPNMYTFISILRCLEDADVIFKKLNERDLFSWTVIISGYAHTDQGEKAIKCFSHMRKEGVNPNEYTLASCLRGCAGIASLENGRQLHSLAIKSGHFGDIFVASAIVDMYGKCGSIEDAEAFFKGLDFRDTVAWNTIISKGRWSDVSKTRALMSGQGVKKEPGCSWVEVDAQTHVFLSQDGSHSKIGEIYQKLEELGQKLTSVGYIPNTDNVLHTVSDREKRENLFYHSERLALAFALISNMPNKTIRIFKNLRICGDCHDFMKLISGTINREIIIRDIKRFHHFRGGTCSCQDYW